MERVQQEVGLQTRAQLRELRFSTDAVGGEAAEVAVADHIREKKDERPQSANAEADGNGEKEGPRVVHRTVDV